MIILRRVFVCFLVTLCVSATSVSAQPSTPVSGARPVSRGSLRGVLMPLHDLQLSSRAAGVIEDFPVAEGETVKEGDLLVQLNADVERAELAQAEAMLEGASSEEDRARREYERAEALRRDSIGSERDYEAAKYAFERAAAQKKQATATVAVARARLQERSLYAPISGLMFKRSKSVGEAVERLETVVRVVDSSKLELVVYVGSELFGQFTKETTVQVVLEDGPGRGTSLDGAIVHVDPIIDPQSGTFRVRVQVPPSQQVQPGLSAIVQLSGETLPQGKG